MFQAIKQYEDFNGETKHRQYLTALIGPLALGIGVQLLALI